MVQLCAAIELAYDTGLNIDVYALGMVLLGLSTTVGAANFVVTLFRLRAPGMSLNRMPILVWGTLTASVANLLVIPSVSLAFFLLWMDRNIGTHIFDSTQGGQALLWQHLFWIFAHPWVYVVVLPAMGIVSDALPTSASAVGRSTCRKGRPRWRRWCLFRSVDPSHVRHRPSGLGLVAGAPPAWSSPSFQRRLRLDRHDLGWQSGVQGAFPRSRGRLRTDVLLAVGPGVMTAAVSLDWQLTETFHFVVAHLHYVLLAADPALLRCWAASYTGSPSSPGARPTSGWGRWPSGCCSPVSTWPSFRCTRWVCSGTPRRSTPQGRTWAGVINLIVSIGAFLFAFGILLFLADIALSLKRGKPAGDNPWDAATLEWATPSPPPTYNFAVIPIINSRHPLWEDRLKDVEGRSRLDEGYTLHGRETIGTTALDAEPNIILAMPGDLHVAGALLPAPGPFFVGLLLHLWFLAGGGRDHGRRSPRGSMQWRRRWRMTEDLP